MLAEPAVAAKPSLTLKRRLAAPPARVYAAWTDPQKLARWWGPDGGPVLDAQTAVRVGGRFRIRFQTLDGEEQEVGGVYREVIADEKLVFTWAWRSTPERESLVTVALKPEGNGTLLILTHEQFFDEPARDRHREGWSGALDRLESVAPEL
jgi:uncharacterized protein YndB with AHSA1/START domain